MSTAPTGPPPADAAPIAPPGASLLAARIARRYGPIGLRLYVRAKLCWDPLFPAVAPILGVSTLPLLDIGCGLGLLGQYLAEIGCRGRYLGIDLDREKIAEAGRAAARAGLDLEFHAADADGLPDFRGNVALLDVLHYLPRDSQRRVLDQAIARVDAGGLLVVRNVLCEDHWRFRATALEERLAHAIGWIGSPVGHYPAREEIVAPLERDGFAVEVAPLWGRTPFNSYLVVGRRRGV